MNFIHRLGDCNSGHGCWPPQVLCSASSNIKVNGKQVGRVGDCYTPHCCCHIPETHSSVVAYGSPTTLINGRIVAIKGSPVSCGGIAVCSSSSIKG